MKGCKACLAAVVTVLGVGAPAHAETIATFTRNPANPILRGVRIGSDIAARSLGAQTVHFIPRAPARLSLRLEILVRKRDRGVLPKSGEISLKGMEQVIALMGEGGTIKAPLPAAENFVDLQYLRAAGVQ